MIKKLISIAMLLTFQMLNAQSQMAKVFAFVNGYYFDSKGFRQGTFYTINGRISFKKPAFIDSTIDVSGKYIIPPFGEAHNYNVEWYGEDRFNRLRDRYLKEGI